MFIAHEFKAADVIVLQAGQLISSHIKILQDTKMSFIVQSMGCYELEMFGIIPRITLFDLETGQDRRETADAYKFDSLLFSVEQNVSCYREDLQNANYGDHNNIQFIDELRLLDFEHGGILRVVMCFYLGCKFD